MKRLAMPLLAKELAEQAARIRTYHVRLLFAAVLYLPSIVMLLFQNGHFDLFGSVDMVKYGAGAEMGRTLWFTLQIAIYLFLPAMTAGAIAAEKENGTLHLLFLTDLTPGEMVLQKYLGRLIPFLTLVLMSLPLFAVGYAYGGLSPRDVTFMAYGLLITVLQVAAIALLCSAQCATAMGAIVATYFVGAGFYFTPYILVSLLSFNFGYDLTSTQNAIDRTLLSWFPSYAISNNSTDGGNLLIHSMPVLTSTFLILLWTVRSTANYIFKPPHSVVSVFRRLDQVFASWNRHFGNVTFFADRATLPDNEPVAWREMHRRGIGRRHHRVRLLLILMIPLVFVLITPVTDRRESTILAIAAITWFICAIILLTAAASSVPSERGNQTLEILLSTSLGTQDIILQKIASLRRLAITLSVPLLTLAVFACLRRDYFDTPHDNGLSILLYVAGTFIGLRYLLWIGFSSGLYRNNRITAVTLAILTSLFLFVAPVLLVFFLEVVVEIRASVLLLFTPAAPLIAELSERSGWSGMFSHWEQTAFFLWIGIALTAQHFIRKKCLVRADRILRGE